MAAGPGVVDHLDRMRAGALLVTEQFTDQHLLGQRKVLPHGARVSNAKQRQIGWVLSVHAPHGKGLNHKSCMDSTVGTCTTHFFNVATSGNWNS